jgi:hypothetical protein
MGMAANLKCALSVQHLSYAINWASLNSVELTGSPSHVLSCCFSQVLWVRHCDYNHDILVMKNSDPPCCCSEKIYLLVVPWVFILYTYEKV